MRGHAFCVSRDPAPGEAGHTRHLEQCASIGGKKGSPMTFFQWVQNNAIFIVIMFFTAWILVKPPSISSWQAFLDSFESKGGQLLLLFVSNVLLIIALVRFWALFDAQLKTTIVGILSAVNGALLGALGAKNTGGNGGTPPKPDTLTASLVVPPEKKP